MMMLKFVVAVLLTFGCLKASSQYEAIQPQGIYSSEFNIDNIARNITYYMPLNYGKFDTYPLVIVLHDANSSAKNVIKSLGDIIHEAADSNNAIILYPDAIAQHWNSKTGASFAATDSINDVGFISIMTDFFVQQYHCDAARIYVTGIGNGGSMAARLQCDNNKKYNKFASINSTEKISCNSATTTQLKVIDAPLKQAMAQAFSYFFNSSNN